MRRRPIALRRRAMERVNPSAAAGCAHCGLPVPLGRKVPAPDPEFCCAGCETVYSVLTEHGLTRYYALAQAAGDRIPAHVTGRGHEELDDPAFIARACTPLPGGLLATDLYLEGVHCAACVWLVEKVPRPRNRLVLKVVAKRPIPEHLEKRVVVRIQPDIIEVVVLAAGANAFLRVGCARG